MTDSVRVFQVDAFTSQRFCGNPAGVVLDADELSERDMQLLARELNNGDTAFVLRPDGPDHDLRLRFFTPRNEAAFVGHATVATHAVLASLQLEPRRRQKQRSGVVEVDTLPGNPPRIAFRQPPPALGRELAAEELDAVLESLALGRSDLDTRCPPQVVGRSSTRVLLGLGDAETLARARADSVRLRALSLRLGAPGYFLFTLRPDDPAVLTQARMFCPALGIEEDPVSGNAHALLGAYLLQHRLLDAATEPLPQLRTIEFNGAQGQHVGRPGRVAVTLELEQGRLHAVSICGEAVIVFESRVNF